MPFSAPRKECSKIWLDAEALPPAAACEPPKLLGANDPPFSCWCEGLANKDCLGERRGVEIEIGVSEAEGAVVAVVFVSWNAPFSEALTWSWGRELELGGASSKVSGCTARS